MWITQYPEDVENGGIVATAPLLPKDTVLGKEQWLIELVRNERTEGRNVLIFTWHTVLPPRLQQVLLNAGIEHTTYLNASKVGTKKREAWINQQIANGNRVLIVPAAAVSTGFNNLVHYSTAIFFEPIVHSILTYQALGRVHRIGQTQPVRVYFPVYQNTTQEKVLDLNAMKMRAGMALHGLDTRDVLQASGADDNENDEQFYELGEAIHHLLVNHPPAQHEQTPADTPSKRPSTTSKKRKTSKKNPSKKHKQNIQQLSIF